MELRSIDKVQGVIIRLRKKSDVTTSKNYLIAMLEELLKKEDAENKKKNLEEKYGFVMSVKTEGRLNDMCNLGEGLFCLLYTSSYASNCNGYSIFFDAYSGIFI